MFALDTFLIYIKMTDHLIFIIFENKLYNLQIAF